MFKIKERVTPLLTVLVLAVLAAGLAGCQIPQPSPYPPDGHIRQSAIVPSYMLSIDQLGSRLGLTVAMSGNPYYEMKNTANRVLLFVHENGRVHVNGQSVAAVGPIVEVNGTYYVSEILEPQIRPHLKDNSSIWTPAPEPLPSSPSWPSRTGPSLVVIDPGHGGRDPGAISYLGHYEKDIVLQISRRLATILQQRGIQVIMTRQGDTFIELEERAAIANQAGANLFVSIHADSHNDRMHQGFTLYIARSASEASRRFGRSFENTLSMTGIPSKGLRTADYRVLVQTSVPAVLVETGFLSSPSEAALLLDGNHQERIAAAIADGIINAL
ncbi:MAG: N-acetylmuramoyl-L-alanine amidase [Phycisphaerae bacterium]|nr:N-acetylmuramoyl-L-alanine amidase [Phycisphaerae bacterium]